MGDNACITWHSPASHPLFIETGELHLWKIDLQALPLEQTTPLLSKDEAKRAQQMANMTFKQRFSAGRGGLRMILSRYLNCRAEAIIFQYGEKGKPAIKTPEQPLQFNMSHAGDLAVIALCADEPVGIDIEPIRSRTHLLATAGRTFGDAVRKKLEQLNPEQQTHAFLEHWTELEARIKAAGAGVFDHKLLQRQDIYSCLFRPQEGWLGNLALIGAKPETKAWSTYNLS